MENEVRESTSSRWTRAFSWRFESNTTLDTLEADREDVDDDDDDDDDDDAPGYIISQRRPGTQGFGAVRPGPAVPPTPGQSLRRVSYPLMQSPSRL